MSQMWPAFLPDGKHFLFLDWKYPSFGTPDDNIWIGSIDGEKSKRLPLASTNAQYSEGYLLSSRDGDLVAQKFDLARLELSGAVLPVADRFNITRFFITPRSLFQRTASWFMELPEPESIARWRGWTELGR